MEEPKTNYTDEISISKWQKFAPMLNAWKTRQTDFNTFYYYFPNFPIDDNFVNEEPFNEIELEHFRERIDEFREMRLHIKKNWGLFSLPFRNRIGRQCKNFYGGMRNELGVIDDWDQEKGAMDNFIKKYEPSIKFVINLTMETCKKVDFTIFKILKEENDISSGEEDNVPLSSLNKMKSETSSIIGMKKRLRHDNDKKIRILKKKDENKPSHKSIVYDLSSSSSSDSEDSDNDNILLAYALKRSLKFNCIAKKIWNNKNKKVTKPIPISSVNLGDTVGNANASASRSNALKNATRRKLSRPRKISTPSLTADDNNSKLNILRQIWKKTSSVGEEIHQLLNSNNIDKAALLDQVEDKLDSIDDLIQDNRNFVKVSDCETEVLSLRFFIKKQRSFLNNNNNKQQQGKSEKKGNIKKRKKSGRDNAEVIDLLNEDGEEQNDSLESYIDNEYVMESKSKKIKVCEKEIPKKNLFPIVVVPLPHEEIEIKIFKMLEVKNTSALFHDNLIVSVGCLSLVKYEFWLGKINDIYFEIRLRLNQGKLEEAKHILSLVVGYIQYQKMNNWYSLALHDRAEFFHNLIDKQIEFLNIAYLILLVEHNLNFPYENIVDVAVIFSYSLEMCKFYKEDENQSQYLIDSVRKIAILFFQYLASVFLKDETLFSMKQDMSLRNDFNVTNSCRNDIFFIWRKLINICDELSAGYFWRLMLNFLAHDSFDFLQSSDLNLSVYEISEVKWNLVLASCLLYRYEVLETEVVLKDTHIMSELFTSNWDVIYFLLKNSPFSLNHPIVNDNDSIFGPIKNNEFTIKLRKKVYSKLILKRCLSLSMLWNGTASFDIIKMSFLCIQNFASIEVIDRCLPSPSNEVAINCVGSIENTLCSCPSPIFCFNRIPYFLVHLDNQCYAQTFFCNEGECFIVLFSKMIVSMLNLNMNKGNICSSILALVHNNIGASNIVEFRNMLVLLLTIANILPSKQTGMLFRKVYKLIDHKKCDNWKFKLLHIHCLLLMTFIAQKNGLKLLDSSKQIVSLIELDMQDGRNQDSFEKIRLTKLFYSAVSLLLQQAVCKRKIFIEEMLSKHSLEERDSLEMENKLSSMSLDEISFLNNSLPSYLKESDDAFALLVPCIVNSLALLEDESKFIQTKPPTGTSSIVIEKANFDIDDDDDFYANVDLDNITMNHYKNRLIDKIKLHDLNVMSILAKSLMDNAVVPLMNYISKKALIVDRNILNVLANTFCIVVKTKQKNWATICNDFLSSKLNYFFHSSQTRRLCALLYFASLKAQNDFKNLPPSHDFLFQNLCILLIDIPHSLERDKNVIQETKDIIQFLVQSFNSEVKTIFSFFQLNMDSSTDLFEIHYNWFHSLLKGLKLFLSQERSLTARLDVTKSMNDALFIFKYIYNNILSYKSALRLERNALFNNNLVFLFNCMRQIFMIAPNCIYDKSFPCHALNSIGSSFFFLNSKPHSVLENYIYSKSVKYFDSFIFAFVTLGASNDEILKNIINPYLNRLLLTGDIYKNTENSTNLVSCFVRGISTVPNINNYSTEIDDNQQKLIQIAKFRNYIIQRYLINSLKSVNVGALLVLKSVFELYSCNNTNQYYKSDLLVPSSFQSHVISTLKIETLSAIMPPLFKLHRETNDLSNKLLLMKVFLSLTKSMIERNNKTYFLLHHSHSNEFLKSCTKSILHIVFDNLKNIVSNELLIISLEIITCVLEHNGYGVRDCIDFLPVIYQKYDEKEIKNFFRQFNLFCFVLKNDFGLI